LPVFPYGATKTEFEMEKCTRADIAG
jgi:hypothetical protein